MVFEILGSDVIYSMLPFLFALVVIYGGLNLAAKKHEFFDNRVNVILSLILSAFAVSSPGIVEFIYSVLPYATILAIILFFIAFLKGVMGNGDMDYSMLMVVIAGIIIFIVSRSEYGFLSDSNTMGIIVLALIVLIFIAAYKQSAT